MGRLLIGIAIGFVIGSAAGRQRFEQLKKTATDVVNKPQVQNALKKADDFVAEKAPALHDAAAAAVDAGEEAK
jgi:hypothetical protein